MAIGVRLPALAGLLVAVATAFVACDDGGDGGGGSAAAAESPTVAAPAASDATAATAATDAGPPVVSPSGTDELGPFLVGPNGHTLYVFTRDEPGVSNCTAGCIANWPPLLVSTGAQPSGGDGVGGELGTIDRADGGRQVTYDGAPLYFWANDAAPGETNGHGVGGVWFVATPGAAAATGGTSSGEVDY